MKDWLKNIIRLSHLWLGLVSGVVIFIVCLTGSLYTFRTQIENAFNYNKVYIERQETTFISIDSIITHLDEKGIKVSQIIHYGKPNRSIEILYSSNDGKESGAYFINPYTGEIIGNRDSALSPFFETLLSLHKSLLLSNTGKQIVGVAILIFVFMLLSGIILWIPDKLKSLAKALKIPFGKRKSSKLIDLHKVPGIYSLSLLLLIAIMGLYISYPWVKSSIIVSFGGNPVLSKASEKQKEKIKDELAGSFAESLQNIIANNKNSEDSNIKINVQNIVNATDSILPYKGIMTITLPGNENSWVKVKKFNRENALKAILPDELVFNKAGELSQKKLFKNKSPDQKLVAISLPLHTGEILGWPSLILYFIVSLVGASLPVTGTLMWYRRKKAQIVFRKKGKEKKLANSLQLKLITSDWLIAYATKSGNSKLIALSLQQEFRGFGLEVRCLNTSQIQLEHLKNIKYLFIVISTDGDGVPPSSAKKLFNQLKANTNSLAHLNYSICALGDTAYEAYCKAGKDLDGLLSQHGAIELAEKVECDTDFAKPSSKWIKQSIKTAFEANGVSISGHSELQIQDVSNKAYEEIIVSEIVKLSNSSNKPCFHIVLKSDSELRHIKPGDSIEINPKNPDWLVDEICNLNEFTAKETTNQLADKYEITSLTKTTIERYQTFANNEKLEVLLKNNKELKIFIANANFCDLLLDYPTLLKDENLKDILLRKKGRLYSVASSTKLYPNELHLTVKAIRYSFKSRLHEGAGSVELTENLNVNDVLRFKHYPNFEFRLPKDNVTPIILIGVGAGIAPFRAFLQENQYNESSSDIWLVWGDKHKEIDFIYEQELMGFQDKGILKKLNLAFSRDGEEKVYVQDLVLQNKAEFIKWVDKGAHIYVCGSLSMADSVKGVVEKILNRPNSGMNFSDMIDNHRYHEDAY